MNAFYTIYFKVTEPTLKFHKIPDTTSSKHWPNIIFSLVSLPGLFHFSLLNGNRGPSHGGGGILCQKIYYVVCTFESHRIFFLTQKAPTVPRMRKRTPRWFADFSVANPSDKECTNCSKANTASHSTDLTDFSTKFWLKDLKAKWWHGLSCKMMINWDTLDSLYILFVLIRKSIHTAETTYLVFIFFFALDRQAYILWFECRLFCVTSNSLSLKE